MLYVYCNCITFPQFGFDCMLLVLIVPVPGHYLLSTYNCIATQACKRSVSVVGTKLPENTSFVRQKYLYGISYKLNVPYQNIML